MPARHMRRGIQTSVSVSLGKRFMWFCGSTRGCARSYIGRIEGANIVKPPRGEPMRSFLSYPGFEKDPHPALTLAVTVHLQTFQVGAKDYSVSRNRPILQNDTSLDRPDNGIVEENIQCDAESNRR